ncbi:MAG: ribosomal-processing cysteine protease Prp [Acetobacter sp.]|nr:ribosomal-processing cysteine protease Prp [Bacteroides sp.]MCM1342056.1 ribosomal-processing cysteine protease Prp [Acetobacter sp.]MCM1434258.1 ribosomal-processing cysteine protease Prp [Clostridiales bacterium]
MLKIYIEKNTKNEKYRLKMKGHCGYAEEGKDIVCAAASILCLTMGQVISDNKDKLEEKPRIVNHNGHCIVEWKPKKEYEGALNNSLYTIKQGLRLLEHTYPTYVKFIE